MCVCVCVIINSARAEINTFCSAQVSPDPETRCTLSGVLSVLCAHQKRIYDCDCAYIWILESIGKSCYHSRFKPFLNRVWSRSSKELTDGVCCDACVVCRTSDARGNCSMFFSRMFVPPSVRPLYRFLLPAYSSPSLSLPSWVCLCIVWIALTCEALRQYLCTTLCQCAKCRRSRRWSCRKPLPLPLEQSLGGLTNE